MYLATRLVLVLSSLMRSRNTERVSRHLQHFRVHSLAHFHGAGALTHRSIRIHMHQCPGLVHHGIGKGDAEANGHQRESFL